MRHYILKIFSFILFISIWPNSLFSLEKRSLLSTSYPPEKLKPIIMSQEEWHPFPTVKERRIWQNIPTKVRQFLISRGEKGINFEWPSLPATLFLEYIRNGNRSNFQRERDKRRTTLANLVIAECVEGKSRFLDDIANGIWVICEESYWGVPAHLSMQKTGFGLPDIDEPTVDLYASETASLLSWILYLLDDELDKVSPLIRKRIQREMSMRVLQPCLQRDDFWWMGLNGRTVNNWNPWCNSNWLTAVLLLETDVDKRFAAVEKIIRSLDKFIDGYSDDGGCDEGPGYWGRAGASLFDCLELLSSVTNGKFNVYNKPLIQEIGKYIYRAHIFDNYFINFSDAAAIVNIAGDLTFRYGKQINDDLLAGFGAYAFQKRNTSDFGISSSIGRQLPAIFNINEIIKAKTIQPMLKDVWMKDLQFMAARSNEGTKKGIFVAFKGGHNNESHNHNDIGNFIVYLDGRPMIIDVGVETYTAKTFSSKRYEIWTMQSAYHNLPTIDGIMQAPGRRFAAKNVKYKSTNKYAELQLDISDSYPSGTNLNSWQRTIRLNRGKNLKIKDSFQLKKPTKDLFLSLMTPCDIQIKKDIIELKDNKTKKILHVEYNSKKLTVDVEDIQLKDSRLKSIWGENIFRILLKVKSSVQKDNWDLVMKS